MKYLRILLLFLCVGSFVQAQNLISPESVNWVRNVDYAQTLALRYNRPILLYFQNYPSTTVEKNVYASVFSNESIVSTVNNSFIPLFVLADTPLARQYNIQNFPTMLIIELRSDRTLGRLSGALLAPSSVANLLRSALAYSRAQSRVVIPPQPPQYFSQIHSPVANPRGTTDFIYNAPRENSNAVVQFLYDGGRFISYNNGTWINQTPFSQKPFYQYTYDEHHLYLADDTNTIFVAVPRLPQKNIWVWDEVSESWMVYRLVAKIENIH